MKRVCPLVQGFLSAVMSDVTDSHSSLLSAYFSGCHSGDLCEFLKCHAEALPVPQGVEPTSGDGDSGGVQT